jgi:hypothetical protein
MRNKINTPTHKITIKECIYTLFLKFSSRILFIDFSTLLEVMKCVLSKEQFCLIYLFFICLFYIYLVLFYIHRCQHI